MKHKILLIISWFIRTITIFYPDEKHIMRFRGYLYSWFIPRCGNNFQVAATVKIINLENLYIGNNVYIAHNVTINAITDILLEDEVMIGFNSVLVSGNHTLIKNSFRYGISSIQPIVIKKGSWIGANCTILSGSNIGECVLVAANSSVRGSLNDYSLYSGVPCKFVKCLR